MSKTIREKIVALEKRKKDVDAKLKAAKSEEIAEISKLVIKHKLNEHNYDVLDKEFENLATSLQSK